MLVASMQLPVLTALLIGAALALTSQEEPSTQVRGYFRLCDEDRNGWVSFREARSSLEVDRREYAIYDSDHDGRVTLAEFQARYQDIVDRGGVFPVPKQAGRFLAPIRDVEGLLAAYDRNSDQALQPAELGQLLTEQGRVELELEVVFGKLDHDGSGSLAGEELPELIRILDTLQAAETPGEAPAPPRASSVEELFGPYVAQRGIGARAAGPLPIFRRLDLDGDGALSIPDLRALAAAPLAPGAMSALAALDHDQSGSVSREEFMRGMSSGAR